jgi:F-type H+-transporting ATPase subunit gamma
VANLKEIKSRIRSVQKTKQITSAMKLVAGAKLKKATERAVSARPYQQRLSDVLERVVARASDGSDPLLERRSEVKKVAIVVLTTDRGLCGGFNNTLLRRTLDFVNKRREAGVQPVLTVYGRKGADFCKSRGLPVGVQQVGYDRTPRIELSRPLADQLTAAFLDGEVDEVYLAYNQFVNTITQRPTFQRVLPMQVEEVAEGEAPSGVDYVYEPSADELLKTLLPLYLRTVVLQAFLETEAGEHAARMTAMDSATRNASDLIDRLTLDYNRARQAAITKELIEIISGAEAL